jgi:hypothetical protein
LTGNPELMNKIIKIQSHIRGMEIRDKIKIRAKPKTSNKQKKNEFTYDGKVTKKVENEDIKLQKKYNEIIVK